MLPTFDIFELDPGGQVVWREAKENLIAARARIQRLVQYSQADYLILDQTSGQRVIVRRDAPAQVGAMSVESRPALGVLG